MKSKGLAVMLGVFFGGIGIHKFYLERPGQGLLYVMFCWTFIPALISMIDVIRMILMNKEQWEKYTTL